MVAVAKLVEERASAMQEPRTRASADETNDGRRSPIPGRQSRAELHLNAELEIAFHRR